MSRLLIATAVAACLAACSERPQILTQSHPDQQAYQGPTTPFSAPGWKAGDEASWAAQIRIRQQGQNEYSRTGSPP